MSIPLQDSRARLIALIVGSAFFMVLLDSAIIATSLPRMAQSFGLTAVELSIGISVYILAVATFVPLSSWMSDRFGARRVFLIAIVIFTVASLACGVATTLPEFIAARALQGLGGAFMTPVGRVLVLRNARKSELIQATALITWPALMAPVIGPVLGGFITTWLSWRWNFFINLPLGIIAFSLAWRFIPRTDTISRRPFDLHGFVLSASALLSLLYGLESLAHQYIPAFQSIALIAAGGVMTYLTVRHLRKTPAPLLKLAPFSVHTFALATLSAGTLIKTGINATPFLLPLLLQVSFGLTPLEAGSYILVYFLGNLGMKTVTTTTLQTFGFKRVLLVNGLLCGLSIAACGLFTPDSGKILIMATLFVAGLTRSMQYTSLNTLAFADISAVQRGSAATLASMLQQISMVLGITLSVIILSGSRWAAQRSEVALVDFSLAFFATGLLVMTASLMFLRLPADAGAEVTGHSG